MHSYTATLKVKNEVGVLARIAIPLRKFRVNIVNLEVSPIGEDKRLFNVVLMLESEKEGAEMKTVIRKIEKLVPVIEAKLEDLKKEV